MMLAEALEAKSRELGHRYSYRDLDRDSGIHYSMASKVIRGRAPASREAIEAWGKALAPHFPVDLALVEAGYMPETPSLRARIRALVARAQLQAGEFITERQAEGEPERKNEQQRQQKPRPAQS